MRAAIFNRRDYSPAPPFSTALNIYRIVSVAVSRIANNRGSQEGNRVPICNRSAGGTLIANHNP
jgi:hypothetical protein